MRNRCATSPLACVPSNQSAPTCTPEAWGNGALVANPAPIGAGWTQIAGNVNALPLAKGVYQQNVIAGWEATSGSTIRGAARGWAYWYGQSRRSLMRRLRAAGFIVDRRPVGRRMVLVIGAPSGAPLSTPCAAAS